MNNNLYNQFLQLLSLIGKKENFKSIYTLVDSFFNDYLDGYICVFSCTAKNLSELRNPRIYTNKKQFETDLDKIKTENKNGNLVEIATINNQIIYCYMNYKNKDFDKIKQYCIEFLGSHHKRIDQLNEIKNLKKLSDSDDVTGLSNQRKLKSDLKYLITNFKKTNEAFSLLFIDIDKYKDVNDGYGHVVGTDLLKQLGKLLTSTIRETDYLYRYGGDEFVVILNEIDEDVAEQVANRFLKKVCDYNFISLGHSFHLSVSIGVATFPNHAQNEKDILEIADKMMYEAKKNGRGIVCSAKDLI